MKKETKQGMIKKIILAFIIICIFTMIVFLGIQVFSSNIREMTESSYGAIDIDQAQEVTTEK